MPAGIVELQHDALLSACTARLGEVGFVMVPKSNEIVVIFIRVLLVVGSLSLILSDGTAGAQSSKSAPLSPPAQTPPTPIDPTKPDRTKKSDQELVAEALAQSLKDWDAATHMTKQEWARVCRRVVDNRAKYYREEGLALPRLR
jgi:hypothetical protein